MTCRQSYRDMHVLYECVSIYGIEHVLGCEVTLVVGFLYWALLTPSWKIISGTGGTPGNEAHTGPQS